MAAAHSRHCIHAGPCLDKARHHRIMAIAGSSVERRFAQLQPVNMSDGPQMATASARTHVCRYVDASTRHQQRRQHVTMTLLRRNKQRSRAVLTTTHNATWRRVANLLGAHLSRLQHWPRQPEEESPRQHDHDVQQRATTSCRPGVEYT